MYENGWWAQVAVLNQLSRSAPRLAAVSCCVLLAAGCASTSETSSKGSGSDSRVTVRGDDTGATSTPSCSAHVTATGRHTDEQLGLVNCYVNALKHRDLHAMARLTFVNGRGSILLTNADLQFASSARSGVASATFNSGAIDPSDAGLKLSFADGRSEMLGIILSNPASAHSWRLLIGKSRGQAPDLSGLPTVSQK